MNHTHLFAFEQDFVSTLRCVPMAVRFKLDRAGIKLSLRQWSRFTVADRVRLLMTPCASEDEALAYRGALATLIWRRTGEIAKPLPEAPCEAWRRTDSVAPAVLRFAALADVRGPDARAWAELHELQRFVLVKLSRDNHDNVNFVPALREFGLLPEVGPVLV